MGCLRGGADKDIRLAWANNSHKEERLLCLRSQWRKEHPVGEAGTPLEEGNLNTPPAYGWHPSMRGE
ncbi:MAG: hypothetical protein ACP5QS_02365 [bacterium]